MLSDILKRVAEEIYHYKAYPEDAHFCAAAEALIKKHPCLKEPGSFNGCYGWKQRLKYKMANYRTQLKLQGCPELCVNSLKSKATTDAFPADALRQKSPDMDNVCLAKSVAYNGLIYKCGMILIHGSLGGLPEFAEIIQMVILQDKLIFIVKKLSGWYMEHYRAYDLKTRSEEHTSELQSQR